ncbi:MULTISPECIES: hypothetical protein [unclassified Mesorhizobium]|uniref:hypothetical protein n=1 Tax=Mesorhizobium TaxID=68287 RepID=UPI001FE1E3DE|nr:MULTISPECIES: hypothetical protein [unclassified Mesorhizobium]
MADLASVANIRHLGMPVAARHALGQAASTADCSASFETQQDGDISGKALGFRLTLQGQDGKPLKILHEDKAVPGSGNCPTS